MQVCGSKQAVHTDFFPSSLVLLSGLCCCFLDESEATDFVSSSLESWPRLAGIGGRVLRRGKLPGFRASLSSRAHTHQLDPDSFHDGRGLEPLCVCGLICGFLKDTSVLFSSYLDVQRLLTF